MKPAATITGMNFGAKTKDSVQMHPSMIRVRLIICRNSQNDLHYLIMENELILEFTSPRKDYTVAFEDDGR